MRLSHEVQEVLRSASDLAEGADQPLTTGHILLALFTSPNRAQAVLKELRVDTERLIKALAAVKRAERRLEESHELLELVEGRMLEAARNTGSPLVTSLHLLLALTREKPAVAYRAFAFLGIPPVQVRTLALGRITGPLPRSMARRERPTLFRDEPAGPVAVADPRAAEPSPEARPSQRPSTVARVQSRSAPAAEPLAVPSPLLRPNPDAPPTDEADENDAPLSAEEAEDPGAPWLLDPELFPLLTGLGRNLSAEAARGVIDPVIGRERVIDTIIDVLNKRRSNNPCLVGEPGVGKTAVVEGLAHRLVNAPPSDPMRERILVGLDVGALLVGTHLRGSFSEKLQGLRDEVKKSDGRVIVFFDELHTLVGAGSTGDGPQDAAHELKGALARGDFPCIGATTYDEYAEHIEKDPALARRFVPVLVKEPSPEEAVRMLAQILPPYADHHGVSYSHEAVLAAVELSTRYISEGHLPDKAIALLDLAGSRAARAGAERVDREGIGRLVAERADLPVERVLASDHQRLLALEGHLRRDIVGHERQMERVAEVIRRNAAGFKSHRPQGVFLFLGPTGVGKTETAKALARLLHGSEDTMIRVDLSEFSEAHTVARLVGAPPGYVGHDAGGQLTEAVRKRPGRVLLFDELEKAHQDVLQVMLQILDEGRLTDGKGRTVSFAETIVILTSNLGADLAKHKPRIGFAGEKEEAEAFEAHVLERAKDGLAPELWGRIEERLVFGPLGRDEAAQICRLLAADSSRRLKRERGISYGLDEDAVDFVLSQGGYDTRLGARPMRHVLSRIVEGPIAARILEGRLHADEHVQVSTRATGGLVFLVGDDSLSQRPRR